MPAELATPFVTASLLALAACWGCGPHPDGGAGGTGGQMVGGGGSPGGGSDGGNGGAGGAIDAPADLPGAGGRSDTRDATTMTDATSERTEVAGNNFCAGHALDGGPIPDVRGDAFCTKYGVVCKFGGPGGYTNLADCLAQYGGAVPPIQSCRASGLCDAALVELAPGVTVAILQAYCTRALTSAACK